MKSTVIGVALAIPLFSFVVGGQAADDEPVPAAPPAEGTKEYYEALKAKYDAEKAAAEAQKAAMAAKYPSYELKPTEGTITFRDGDLSAMGQWLEFEAVRRIGTHIGNAILTGGECTIGSACRTLVTTRQDIAASAAEQAWLRLEMQQRKVDVENLQKELTNVSQEIQKVEGAIAGLGAGALLYADSIIKSIGGLVGYFKADYTIKGETYTPTDEALVAAVTGVLRSSAVREGLSIPTESLSALKDLKALTDSLMTAARQATDIKDRVGKLNDEQKKKAAASIESLARVITQLGEVDGFLTKIRQRPDDGKPSLLERVIVAESAFAAKTRQIAFLKIVNGGNVTIGRQGIFKRTSVTYLGTIAAAYTLTNANDGSVVLSGVVTCAVPLKMYLANTGKERDAIEPNPMLVTGSCTEAQASTSPPTAPSTPPPEAIRKPAEKPS